MQILLSDIFAFGLIILWMSLNIFERMYDLETIRDKFMEISEY